MKRPGNVYRWYLVWGLSGPLLFLNFWVLGQLFVYFEQVITILTSAAIFALLLSYPTHWLEKRHVGRVPAILLVLTTVVAGITLLGFTVIPLVFDQATQLLNLLPQWLDSATQQLSWLQQIALRHRLNLNLNQIVGQFEQLAQTIVSSLPGLAIGTLGRVFDFVLILVLTLYMLLYGQQMWQGLIDLLPSRFGQAFNQSLQFNVRQFFISQFLLALFMLVGLIPIFVLLQVKFALLFALIIGLFELIPFIGATLGILLVTLLTLIQGFWPALWVGLASVVLQQVRDN
ncbi:MAG TPA: AI-2E family transporter, partial [Stenomitos sp.]